MNANLEPTQMNDSIRTSPVLVYGVNTLLITCGAAAAFWGEFFMRSHHPVVAPHSEAEGAATLVLFVSIVLLLIVLPMIGVFRFSRVRLPWPARLVVWFSFAAVAIVVTTIGGRTIILPYTGAAAFSYLFACDALSAFRSRSWLIAAISLVPAICCAAGFFIIAAAILYFE